MTSKDIKALDKQNVMNTYGRFDVVIDHGRGSTLYTPEGRAYIDFTSGIGVNSIGCANPKWVDAVTAQASKLGHISNLFYTEPCARLAAELTARTGMSCAFFGNSGAEANEGLLKLARKYSFDKYGQGRSTILTLGNSFHGRTVTTLAATGQDVFHNYFFPFTEGFRTVPANDIGALRAAAGRDVCAVLMEVVQGEGGVLPLDPAFVTAAAGLCRENDLLLLIDEVQTGIGRTGTLFAYQQYGLEPDAVSFAKGIAGGLPMGGFLANEKCRNVLSAGTHASTFGGNPVCSAAALAVLDTLTPDFLEEVKAKGAYIRKQIQDMHSPYISGVRGMGLMLGAVVTGVSHKELAARMIAEGLLILTAGTDTLRMLPSLTITYEEIDRGLAIFRKVLEALQ